MYRAVSSSNNNTASSCVRARIDVMVWGDTACVLGVKHPVCGHVRRCKSCAGRCAYAIASGCGCGLPTGWPKPITGAIMCVAAPWAFSVRSSGSIKLHKVAHV